MNMEIENIFVVMKMLYEMLDLVIMLIVNDIILKMEFFKVGFVVAGLDEVYVVRIMLALFFLVVVVLIFSGGFLSDKVGIFFDCVKVD